MDKSSCTSRQCVKIIPKKTTVNQGLREKMLKTILYSFSFDSCIYFSYHENVQHLYPLRTSEIVFYTIYSLSVSKTI